MKLTNNRRYLIRRFKGKLCDLISLFEIAIDYCEENNINDINLQWMYFDYLVTGIFNNN